MPSLDSKQTIAQKSSDIQQAETFQFERTEMHHPHLSIRSSFISSDFTSSSGQLHPFITDAESQAVLRFSLVLRLCYGGNTHLVSLLPTEAYTVLDGELV